LHIFPRWLATVFSRLRTRGDRHDACSTPQVFQCFAPRNRPDSRGSAWSREAVFGELRGDGSLLISRLLREIRR
jgi:hypothetical protein